MSASVVTENRRYKVCFAKHTKVSSYAMLSIDPGGRLFTARECSMSDWGVGAFIRKY